MTFLFILMTLPTAVASFFYNRLMSQHYGPFIILLFNSVTFSYHAFNFFLFVYENKIFKRKLKSVYKKGPYSSKPVDETNF